VWGIPSSSGIEAGGSLSGEIFMGMKDGEKRTQPHCIKIERRRI